jgi:hypothetical protein
MDMNDDDLTKLADALQETGALTDDERKAAQQVISGTDSYQVPDSLAKTEEESSEKESDDIRKKLLDMKLPEKMKLAMFGNSTCRSLLIGDGNKLVQMCVLKNPQIREGEVEEFSKNPNLSDQVLRKISQTKEWMRSYNMKKNLVFNPKTPQDVSLKWLRHLRANDLRTLTRSKNVPQNLTTLARKRLADVQKGK